MTHPEGSTGKKPFELHRVTHSPTQVANGLEARARRTLQAVAPDKRVVVFTQHGEHDVLVSRWAALWVLQGKPPRDAIAEAEGLFVGAGAVRLGESPDLREVKKFKKRARKEYSTGFLASAADMVTRLAEEFPGQVLWVPEGVSNDTVTVALHRHIFNRKNMLRKLGFESRASRASRRRLEIAYRATQSRLRKDTVREEVKQMMEHEDTVAGFGLIGGSHPGLEQELRDGGLAVTVHEGLSRNGEVNHEFPIQELANRTARDPKATITDAEIKAAYRAERKVRAPHLLTVVPLIDAVANLSSTRFLISRGEREGRSNVNLATKAHALWEKEKKRLANGSEPGKHRNTRSRRLREDAKMAAHLPFQGQGDMLRREPTKTHGSPQSSILVAEDPLQTTELPLQERQDARRGALPEQRIKRQGKGI